MQDQYKKAKENNGKSGEEPKSSPFYDQFGRILSERAIFTMPQCKEVGQEKGIASPNFGKSHQNNKEKSQANNTNDSKFFVFPKSDILELLKGHLLCTEFRFVFLKGDTSKVRHPGVIKSAPTLNRV